MSHTHGRKPPAALAAERDALLAHAWAAHASGDHPTLREMARSLGLPRATACDHAARLREAGRWPPWEGVAKPRGRRAPVQRGPAEVPPPTVAEIAAGCAAEIERRVAGGWRDRRWRVEIRTCRVSPIGGRR